MSHKFASWVCASLLYIGLLLALVGRPVLPSANPRWRRLRRGQTARPSVPPSARDRILPESGTYPVSGITGFAYRGLSVRRGAGGRIESVPPCFSGPGL